MPEGHTVHRLARTFGALFARPGPAVAARRAGSRPGQRCSTASRLVASRGLGQAALPGLRRGFHSRGHGWRTGGAPAVPADDELPGSASTWASTGRGRSRGTGRAEVVHAIGAPRKRIGERDSVPAGPLETLARRERTSGALPPAARAVRVRLLGDHAVADLTGPTACEDRVRGRGACGRGAPRPRPDPGRPGPRRVARQLRGGRAARSRASVGQQLMDQDGRRGRRATSTAPRCCSVRAWTRCDPGRDVPAATLRGIWATWWSSCATGPRRARSSRRARRTASPTAPRTRGLGPPGGGASDGAAEHRRIAGAVPVRPGVLRVPPRRPAVPGVRDARAHEGAGGAQALLVPDVPAMTRGLVDR